MADALYRDFYDPTHAFEREPRAFCYEMASALISEARTDNPPSWYTDIRTVRGILLLLFCWNFAARKTKSLTIERTHHLLRQNEARLRQLEGYSLLTFTEQEEPIIQKVFSSFCREFDQTGAAKALSLLNPPLFVMWDTAIRQRVRRELIRGIDNGQTGEQYLLFVESLRQYSLQYNFQQRLAPGAILAKKIDEYHYVEIVMD